MRILFIGLCACYTEGMTYQDQMLTKQCIEDGNEMYFISDAHEFKEGKVVDVDESDRILANGLHLIQLKYNYILTRFLTSRLRRCRGIERKIDEIKPDIIFVHCPNTIAMYEISRYMKKHPEVRFLADTHTDYFTSGTNVISRVFLHKLIYKRTFRECLKYTDKILCTSVNCLKFANEIYGIPKENLEYYSLGGTVLQDKEKVKKEKRDKFGYHDDEMIFLQAGKIDARKCLLEALDEFEKFPNHKWRYIVVGSLADDVKTTFLDRIKKNPRIEYKGWMSGDQIQEYMAACDLYIQPGKVSALAQNAICMGAPIVVRKFEEYELFVEKNGWLISNVQDLHGIFEQINSNAVDLKEMEQEAISIAQEKLDYRTLAKRIYEG